MTQIFFMTDGDDLLDDLVDLGHTNDHIRRIVGTEHHQIHSLDPDPVVGLKHISVEVLLDAVVIERCIGQRDAIEAPFAAKSLYHRLA